VICAGCKRELDVGDQYIEGTASEMIGRDVGPEAEALIADIMGGNASLDGSMGGEIVYCEDCTVRGGNFRFNTYYGDEENEPPSPDDLESWPVLDD
jgi:hypothetical protein